MLITNVGNKAQTLFDSVVRWAANVGMICLACSAVLITLDAGGRYLFNSPLQGVHALVQGFFQPALIFLSIALAARLDAHLKIEIITLANYPRLQRWRNVLFRIFISAFWTICAWQAGKRAWVAYVQNQWPVGEIAVPDVIAYGMTAFGCALAAVAHCLAPLDPAQAAERDARETSE